MSRVQLSINVAELDEAVEFYTRLFGLPPAKVRPGYANFAIQDPPLKLVLNSPGNGEPGTINHLGVEVTSSGEVAGHRERLRCQGLEPEDEPEPRCCYALQDKTWVRDPDSLPWEFYTVLEHIESW